MTIVPLYQPALTDWQRLTPQQKRDQVRQHVERDGLSYSQAAAILGCAREAIAGVVERAKRAKDPIKSNSGLKNQKGVHKKQKLTSTPNRRVKVRKPHQGLTNLIPLSPPTDPEPLNTDAWSPLPGSSPVPLADLGAHACKWPLSDRPFLFCALPAKPLLPATLG